MIFHFGTSQLMCQNKLLGVVGGVLGWHTLLIFQKLFTGKSVFLINQFTFWNFSHVNTIKCIFARQCYIHLGWCFFQDVLSLPLYLSFVELVFAYFSHLVIFQHNNSRWDWKIFHVSYLNAGSLNHKFGS